MIHYARFATIYQRRKQNNIRLADIAGYTK